MATNAVTKCGIVPTCKCGPPPRPPRNSEEPTLKNSLRLRSGMPIKVCLDDMRTIAARHGGKCLSDAYLGGKTKLLWQCAEGHQWEAIPNNVKTGYWCPHCAGNARGQIHEMAAIARKRGGECLSDTYINSHTPLFWRCADEHQWQASPNNIKSGKWCPYCRHAQGDDRRDARHRTQSAEERVCRVRI